MRLLLKSRLRYFIDDEDSGLFLPDGTKIEGVSHIEYTKLLDSQYGTLDIHIDNVAHFIGENEDFFDIIPIKKDDGAKNVKPYSSMLFSWDAHK